MLINVDEFIQESKKKQEMNTYYIEAETETTRTPSTGIYERYHFKNIYNEDLWYYEGQEYLQNHSLSPDKSIRVYESPFLYSYILNANDEHPKLFGPEGIIQSDGQSYYEEDLKYDKDTTLKQSIDRQNLLGNCIIHWYDSTCYADYQTWDKNEKPKVTKITKDCINIKFSKNREACISKQYGIATYYKWQYFDGDIINEINVVNLKDRNNDGYRFDFSTLNLPSNKRIRTEEEFRNEPG
ncbi:MAG: hypothetical protein MJ237_05805 [bacterium]|nr:hypothetical protein [bacterium]